MWFGGVLLKVGFLSGSVASSVVSSHLNVRCVKSVETVTVLKGYINKHDLS